MRRIIASIVVSLAAAAALVAAAPASAASYDVPSELGGTLTRVVARAGIPVLVPDRIALDFSGSVYPSGWGGRRSWSMSLSGAKRCGGANACFLATFSAKRGAKPHFRQRVRLRGGRRGWYKPLTCGASCSPPAIEFRRGGVLYEFQAKVSASRPSAQRAQLVAAANSALAAGPRTLPLVTVKSAAYKQSFMVRRCVNAGESDLLLRGATADGFTVAIAVTEMQGTLHLDGGNEQDALTADGVIDRLRVGDTGHIIASGHFTSGLSGDFRVTGDCA